MRVLLVTSDREQCGIREWGRMLQEELAKLEVEVVEYPHPGWPAGGPSLPPELGTFDIVHVNHHAALHASLTPDLVRYMQSIGWKVVVTQHDTFETSQIMQERGFEAWISADAWVTHELVQGLQYCTPGNPDTARFKTYFVPQGVPAAPGVPIYVPPSINDAEVPCLGLFGFDFPWKNFDLAVSVAAQAGWQVLILSPGASPERVAHWRSYGAQVGCITEYLPTPEVVRYLAGCTATAFLYTCGNSGTSGAIRLGLAARRPLVAFKCRQFRDLYDKLGVWWADGEDELADFLEMIRDPAIAEVQVKLVSQTAEEMSWARVAQRYKEIYERVLELR